jgi:hypothetical protein
MLAFQGPAQPSRSLGDALNAGYDYRVFFWWNTLAFIFHT